MIDPERGALILVVDDEWLIASSLEMMITDIGHEVEGPAADVPQALALIDERQPDAAFLDVKLREGNSFRIAEALEARHVPFAFLTGHTIADLPAEFAGCVILEKPVTRETLQAFVSQILGRPAGGDGAPSR
jgi:DNA-binding NtrC family response regulator